ncbi:MAG: hypothetical protein Q8L02_04745 [Candidatus Nitrotoga sp.]|nr:hypothetical protein [Candidatus Nitrotoga sp.]
MRQCPRRERGLVMAQEQGEKFTLLTSDVALIELELNYVVAG